MKVAACLRKEFVISAFVSFGLPFCLTTCLLISSAFPHPAPADNQESDRQQSQTQNRSETDRKPARNSTRKIRKKPSSIAAKVGMAVDWSPNFETAQRLAKSSGKPIFWYVPTVRGTFMDRKPVIHRYMMAGYFSWPETISTINENFVPVKSAPTPEQQQQYGLSVYKFVEPGFLILTSDAIEQAKVDRITTQHPAWLMKYLARFAGKDANQNQLDWKLEDANDSADSPKRQFAAAVQIFRSGNHTAAQKAWEKIAQQYPAHPLGWKSAAEAEGIGPFTRGFEVYGELPERAYLSGVESSGSTAPPDTFTQPALWKRGVEFLLSMQRQDGGFYDSDYDFGGTDSLPNVHVAVSALAGMALLEAKEFCRSEQTELIENSIKRCLEFVTNESNLNRIDRDEILWADAYRLRLIARSKIKGSELPLTLKLQTAVQALESLQSRRGTWYHEYENPFVTATALIALDEAGKAGAEIDQKKIQSAVNALKKLRGQDGSFPYGSRPSVGGDKATAASAGRMPLCELGLHLWGSSDQNRLKYSIEKSFEYHRHLNAALKYDDHTSTFGYGGFFFWYDMRSRTEAIAAIQDSQLKNTMMRKQLEIIMQLPELDGCFVDSHELGRCYATAMALLCLKRIHQELKD